MAELKPVLMIPIIKGKGTEIEFNFLPVPKWIAEALLAWAKAKGEKPKPIIS